MKPERFVREGDNVNNSTLDRKNWELAPFEGDFAWLHSYPVVYRVLVYLFSLLQVSAALPKEEVVEDIRLKLMAVTELSS